MADEDNKPPKEDDKGEENIHQTETEQSELSEDIVVEENLVIEEPAAEDSDELDDTSVDETEELEETAEAEEEEPSEATLKEQAEQLQKTIQKITDDQMFGDYDVSDTQLTRVASNVSDTDMLEYLEYLWMIWADFSISILSPLIDPVSPAIVINPIVNEEGKKERVFSIHDEGFRLTTSRGEESFSLGQSMFKFFNTIEKMIKLLVERLQTGGIDKETEVRVAFYGFELGQRKAFESILNLQENVVVTNYDPGEWGDRYMKNILEMAERGYGLPPASPRTKF